jgi:transcriptional regulator with XRE-family HTH domain
MDFGSNLAQVRKDKNITQQALSDATGFDKRMISRWEGGNTKPNIEAAAVLAKALDVSLDVLTGLNHSSDPLVSELTSLAKKLSKEDLNAVLHVVGRLAGFF